MGTLLVLKGLTKMNPAVYGSEPLRRRRTLQKVRSKRRRCVHACEQTGAVQRDFWRRGAVIRQATLLFTK